MKKSLMILLAITLLAGGLVFVSCADNGDLDVLEGSGRAAETFSANKTGSKNGWVMSIGRIRVQAT